MTSVDQQPAAWVAFFGSSLGAAATLTGLLFVAVSINLERVVQRPRLLARAAETLVGLLLIVTVSAVLLVPQSRTGVATEVLLVGVAVGAVTLRAQLRHGPDSPADPCWWFLVRITTVQGVTLPTVVGATSLLLDRGAGLRWVALGVVAGFTLAVYAAWVLLVEIVRQQPAQVRDPVGDDDAA